MKMRIDSCELLDVTFNARGMKRLREIYINTNQDGWSSLFRCNLVFQRYYELIQHQQKKCYKDDCLAQANDNKVQHSVCCSFVDWCANISTLQIVEESLTDEEKAQLIQQTALASINDAKPADLVKLLGASKSSTEALLKLVSANWSQDYLCH